MLTRVHVRNTLSDVLHLERNDLGLTVTAALRRIADEGRGVVVVLAGDETPDSADRAPYRAAAPTSRHRRSGASSASARRSSPISA